MWSKVLNFNLFKAILIPVTPSSVPSHLASCLLLFSICIFFALYILSATAWTPEVTFAQQKWEGFKQIPDKASFSALNLTQNLCNSSPTSRNQSHWNHHTRRIPCPGPWINTLARLRPWRLYIWTRACFPSWQLFHVRFTFPDHIV